MERVQGCLGAIKKKRVVICLRREWCETRDMDQKWQAFAESCFRFTSKVALRRGEAVFLDVDENQAFSPMFRLRCELLAARFGLKVKWGVGGVASIAYAKTKGWFQPQAPLSLEILYDLDEPFTPSSLRNPGRVKAIRELIEKLSCLGIADLQAFLKLPRVQILSRFGKELAEASLHIAVELSQIFSGDAQTLGAVWPEFRPESKVDERIDLDDMGIPISYATLESLLFVMKGLSDRVMAGLKARKQRLSGLQIELRFEASSLLRPEESLRLIQMRFPIAQGGVPGVLSLIRERLACEIEYRPFPAGVAGLALRVQETVPGVSYPKDFLKAREEESQEVFEGITARLIEGVGGARVFQLQPAIRFRPERMQKRRVFTERVVDREQIQGLSVALKAERPTRLLRSPLRLKRQSPDQLCEIESEAPARCWKVVRWEGPERIDSEWWSATKGSVARDYFRVTTASGERFWVFVNRVAQEAQEPVYLHGYFD